ncbi:hypothetical protein LJR039_004264 [Pseudorhodoferax sp. LjRoot39]|uniref:hypothetical protein n=1 Tax=Pseudorhodoferax sp. LjRoot39 TaxID=3342328 RepID=UPI003ECF9FBA
MVRCICFDWGGTLMAEDGPQDRAMALWPQVEAMPDAHATLAALGAHWPLHIATNQRQWRRPSTASKEVLGRHSQQMPDGWLDQAATRGEAVRSDHQA